MTGIKTTTFVLQVLREDLENGVASMAMIDTFKVKLSVKLVNVKQVGSTITGGVQVMLETPIGDVSQAFPFTINTGLANPITIPLGNLAGFAVAAEFSYDIPKKMVCVELVVGPFKSGKLCINW
jgi:hypothetical protein